MAEMSSEPAGPAGPAEPAGPAGPAGPAEPAGPAGPAGPPEPAGPAGPPEPAHPGDPAGSGGARRWLLLGAALAVLRVAGGATVYLVSQDTDDPPVPAASELPRAGASQPGSVAAPPRARTSASRPATDGYRTVLYRFDGGLTGQVPDEGGSLPLKVAAVAGGALTSEPRDGGLAVRFPKPCAVYGDKSCPRAILETAAAETLNPGSRPLRYGAAVRLAADETAKGENVLQKGFSQGDSQFKLQIDGAAGRPSCVLVGAGSPEIHVATAPASVADGRWHQVECARDGGLLTVQVDGAVLARSNVPESLSIVNQEPLRIGGKGTSANNDQFHGAIDDVFVAIRA